MEHWDKMGKEKKQMKFLNADFCVILHYISLANFEISVHITSKNYSINHSLNIFILYINMFSAL